MSRTAHICLMASYNAWMNANLYAAARNLPDAELSANRKAYFGSILGTMNHLVVGDTIWLKRFANHPANHQALAPMRPVPVPESLDQLLFRDIESLSEHRQWLDAVITAWSGSISESDLDHVLHYTNLEGVAANRNFFSLVMHFFNHQTHHRGQITTMLAQTGIDVGVTDLLALIADEPGART